jgi:transketolase
MASFPGEDGPTHQPVEQLPALRAIPELAVYRPGDPVETAECWELILEAPRQAALVALSRQPMLLVRQEPGTENKSVKGGYVLLEARDARGSSPSEHRLGTASGGPGAGRSQNQGIPTAVISMPCRLLLQDDGPWLDPRARRCGSRIAFRVRTPKKDGAPAIRECLVDARQ